MAKRKDIELHILVGLPGSGKTTFAKSYSNYDNYNGKNCAEIIDFDNIHKKHIAGSIKSLDYDDLDLCSMVFWNYRYNMVILDGLFLTYNDFDWVIGLYLSNSRYNITKLVFHYWIPDREACLWNDNNRRDLDSAMSIKNLVIEKPDKKYFESKYNISTKVEIHSVVRKPEYLVACDNAGLVNCIYNNRYLTSYSWSLGGTGWGWDGKEYPISGEEPVNFDEFDALLEYLCPTITFLQYKKLYKKCVSMEEKSVYDYYSRGTNAYYICDLELLFDELKNLGIIN